LDERFPGVIARARADLQASGQRQTYAVKLRGGVIEHLREFWAACDIMN